ncbi:hypothetical protein FJT64_008017 [Amphibalanus amphitrite]|uniref:SWIM-type domain-containing protein n=1 Tax=Amphibalanus amphitrite TaxID=1232801 RepID=A0A6A4VD73_AMPAM|nr:hypothetical protein FJT64_008017 [Amphibalanus amphitrite]
MLEPENRRLTEDEKEVARQFHRVGADKKRIRQHMLDQYGKVLTRHDLNNVLRVPKNGQPDLEAAISILSERGFASTVVEDAGTVCGLFFQDQEMRSAYEKFPDLLLMDSTYKLLDIRTPVWLTDKDRAEKAAIKDVFPDCDQFLCSFHVLQSFRRELNLASVEKGERERILGVLQQLVFARKPPRTERERYRQLLNVTSQIASVGCELTGAEHRQLLDKLTSMLHFLQQRRSFLIVEEDELVESATVTLVDSPGGLTACDRAGRVAVSSTACDCLFYRHYSLPCRHIMAVRLEQGMCLFSQELVGQKWLLSFAADHLEAQLDCRVPFAPSVSTRSLPPGKPPRTERERYRQLLNVTSQIASVGCELTGAEHRQLLDKLTTMLHFLQQRRSFLIVEEVDGVPTNDSDLPTDAPPSDVADADLTDLHSPTGPSTGPSTSRISTHDARNVQLHTLTMPPRVAKNRGRPKGSKTTVIGALRK